MESWKDHVREKKDVDNVASDTSSTTQFTPNTGFTFEPPSLGDTPWYDNTYMILDKQTRKAITLAKDGTSLHLQACDDGPNPWNSWLGVCKNNYTAFLSKRSGRFLGHNGKEINGSIHTVALKLDQWESFIPRPHPEGGYQILSPFWGKHLMLLVKTSGGKIERAHHGDTLWIFEEV